MCVNLKLFLKNAPTITAPWQRVNVRDESSLMNQLDRLDVSRDMDPARVVVMLNAGLNRRLNGYAAMRVAETVRKYYSKYVEVIANVDDEEIWPERIQDLRKMEYRDRVTQLREVFSDEMMEADPFLSDLKRELGNQVPLGLYAQPLSNSYFEAREGLMRVPENTSHVIWAVSCFPLQRRMRMGIQDAIAAGEYNQDIEHVALLCHGIENYRSELMSLLFARMVRLFGRNAYVNVSRGEGGLGKIKRAAQDLKTKIIGWSIKK